MDIDRKAFFAALGPGAAFEAMTDEERAEALDSYMMSQLGKRSAIAPPTVRRGMGVMFGGPTPKWGSSRTGRAR
jgi:hypothetical protein